MRLPILLSILVLYASTDAAPNPFGKAVIPNYIGLPLANNAKVEDTVPDCYLAVYHSNATQSAVLAHQNSITRRLAKRGMGEMMQAYQISGWNAFAIQTDEKTMLEIYNAPEINYIEADTKVKATVLLSQTGGPAGLSRISHKVAGASQYVFDDSAGKGVNVYIIDTGIFLQHQEFVGRGFMGANFVAGSANTDENGHGTHVAGTIGGMTFGVAKAAKLIGVKVLDASGAGSNSQVLSGIDWVAKDVTSGNTAGRAVINMSLGGPRSRAVNAAVTAANRAGITVVAAAGNDAVDAINDSPASSPQAITVAAIDSADQQAVFSNFGSAVDVYAPGVQVRSAAITSTSASRVLSGTSMAAPHIAGLCAYLITLEGLTTPDAVQARVRALAVEGGGVVSNAGPNTNAGIAYNGSGL